jgi:hypothetical protein
MFRCFSRAAALAACVAFSLAALPAVAQNDAQRWIPPNTNTIALVRVGELLNSKLGQRRKWVEEYRDAYATGAVSAPPSVLEVMRATEYRPYSRAEQPVFSIYTMRVDVSMSDIAKHELAKAEPLGDTFVVPSSRGVYFVRLGNKLLGALQPADRQLLARWVKFGATNKETHLSDYLQAALEPGDKAQVMVAVDLTDMSEPSYVARWLAASPAVIAARSDVAKLADQFATLRGLRLSVAITDNIDAELRLDFAEPLTASPELMKGIVLEWLDSAGARVDALAHAEGVVQGKSFVLRAPLEEQGLRRILSMIQTRHPAEPATEANAEGAQPANAVASLRYYKGVVAAVMDLSRTNRKASDYEKTALWHENYAVRIENLSTVGVDPDLTAWGYDVAQKLRALASSLRGVPVEVSKLDRAIRYNVQTYNERVATTEWGAYFRPQWYTASTNLQDVRAAQEDVIAKDGEDRERIWSMLEEDRLAIVRKMNEKYGVDFDKK